MNHDAEILFIYTCSEIFNHCLETKIIIKKFLHFFCTSYKKIPSPIKILKERIERLINLEPANIIRIKLVIDKAIDEINLMKNDAMKNFDDIETKIMIKERWMTKKNL